MTQLLAVDNLSKRFGGFVALDGISISVNPGERIKVDTRTDEYIERAKE